MPSDLLSSWRSRWFGQSEPTSSPLLDSSLGDPLARWRAKYFGGPPVEDSEEMERAKDRKEAELKRLAGATSLMGGDRAEDMAEKRETLTPGLQVNPIAERIGQRQAAAIGADTSNRNWSDTLGNAGEAFGRGVLSTVAFPASAAIAADEWLEKKEDEGSAIAQGLRMSPVLSAPRIGRALIPDPVIDFLKSNQDRAEEAAGDAGAYAPHMETGAVLGGVAKTAGELLDYAGIGAALTRQVPKVVAREAFPLIGQVADRVGGLFAEKAVKAADAPIVPRTSRWFSKEGGLPEDLYEHLQAVKKAGEGADYVSARSIDNVGRAVRDELRTAMALETPEAKAAFDPLIQRALEGEEAAMAALPARLHKPVSEARQKLDDDSHRILTNALFSEEAAGNLRFAAKATQDPQGVARFFEAFSSRANPGTDEAARGVARNNITKAQEWKRAQTPEVQQALDSVLGHLETLPAGRRAVADHYMPVLASIGKNQGRYLRTSYQAFDDPRYAKKLIDNEQAESFQKFVKFLVDENGKTPEEARGQARSILQEIIDRGDEYARKGSIFAEFPEAAKSALLKKGDVPEPLAEFLGIHRDWRVGLQRGHVAAAQIGAEIKMWDDMLNSPSGQKVFALGKKGDGAWNAEGQHLSSEITKGPRMIAPDGMAYYTTPEIKEILERATEAASDVALIGKWNTANSLIRTGWTVGNPATRAMNKLNNVILGLKTGISGEFFKEARHAKQTENARIFGRLPNAPEDLEREALREEFAKRGLMTSGGALAEERKHLGSLIGVPSRGVRGKLTPGPEKRLGINTPLTDARDAVAGAVGKGLDWASAGFTAPDQGIRISHAIVKSKQLAKAYPNKSEEWILDEAARRARLEIPTPEDSPQFIQKLRQNPVGGSLVTFNAEILRTGWNSLKLGWQDFRKGWKATPEQAAAEGFDRNALMALGVGEMAGAAGSMGVVPAIALGARMTMEQVNPGSNDKDVAAARRRFLPDYYQNNDFVSVSPKGDNRQVLLDFSPLQPYAIAQKAIAQLVASIHDDEGAAQAAMKTAEELMGPFTQLQPLAISGIELGANASRMGEGAEIYDPKGSKLEIAADSAAHVWKQSKPGFLKSKDRLVEADQLGDNFKAYREIASWFGLRMYRFDANQDIGFKARDRQQSYNRIKKIRTEAVKKEFLRDSSPVVLAAESKAQQEWVTELVPEIQKDIAAAKVLGKTDAEIIELFSSKTSALPKYHIEALLRGQVLPLRWDD